MKRQLTLAALWLLPPCLVASGLIAAVLPPQDAVQINFPRQSQIRMEVAFDQKFTSHTSQAAGFAAWIYCRWTNVSATGAKLLLKDHDAYHGTLEYPWSLQVRVTDKTGNVLTENPTLKDGWWSSAVLESQISKVMPGDVVVLKPGETVVRKVPLERGLMGLTPGAADHRLPPDGEYSIEVRMGEICATSPLTLRVGQSDAAVDVPTSPIAPRLVRAPPALRP